MASRDMEILLGADHVTCALGSGSTHVLDAMLDGQCGLVPETLPGGIAAYVGRAFPKGADQHPLEEQLLETVASCRAQLSRDVFAADGREAMRSAVILSTTKGEIGFLEKGDTTAAFLPALAERLRIRASLPAAPIVVSNACASGTLAIKLAADLIRAGSYDHVLVIGGDLLSRFTLSGFASLHALSAGPCRPFDRTRDGVSLGEAVAGVVLSNDRALFKEPLGRYIAGGMGNDANHISGPSRTGEGLVRAVNAALRAGDKTASDIGHINAHGTGSSYNDRMEAVAFGRLDMEHVPTNSHKGYFGHTLGAAGVLETILSLHAMHRKQLPASLGANDLDELPPLNVLQSVGTPLSNLLLKTSSGFGGCNAAIFIEA
ncbi:MAG: beta-ketoacyl synthase N-terminal-like domain-containing protein [Flavobacteriales bacterium]